MADNSKLKEIISRVTSRNNLDFVLNWASNRTWSELNHIVTEEQAHKLGLEIYKQYRQAHGIAPIYNFDNPDRVYRTLIVEVLGFETEEKFAECYASLAQSIKSMLARYDFKGKTVKYKDLLQNQSIQYDELLAIARAFHKFVLKPSLSDMELDALSATRKLQKIASSTYRNLKYDELRTELIQHIKSNRGKSFTYNQAAEAIGCGNQWLAASDILKTAAADPECGVYHYHLAQKLPKDARQASNKDKRPSRTSVYTWAPTRKKIDADSSQLIPTLKHMILCYLSQYKDDEAKRTERQMRAAFRERLLHVDNVAIKKALNGLVEKGKVTTRKGSRGAIIPGAKNPLTINLPVAESQNPVAVSG